MGTVFKPLILSDNFDLRRRPRFCKRVLGLDPGHDEYAHGLVRAAEPGRHPGAAGALGVRFGRRRNGVGGNTQDGYRRFDDS
ncbi:MAG TPA: hypothetical protein PKA33_07155 [Amaricoccus sp.]|uniref:hypothetical protein n=1 Tax=Amaricoccus sp. TaxID=1872485 RepID=UPI002CB858C0|nr:hypothetical protein [Amaricoccus sp.]HMQ94041.1 hypothetical protein [Amaricoccus sp.]HMR51814.1 hypothetical protein [Amaricoccus sp.]HMR59350.1 hypothetical protein [Amaricoccus sp.]HMT99132.1 hypothetical protein [Amaricoccus sp.]